MTNKLIILAKRPNLGFVKTRLAREVGDDRALAIYNLMLHHLLDWTKEFSTTVYWTGDGDIGHSVDSKEQTSGDLGERIHQALIAELMLAQVGVVIGVDCPELDAAHIRCAFSLLKNHDVVIGPALDGGYYLIGMRNAHKALFHQMEWSTNRVFSETLKRCRQLGLSIATLPQLSDVDEWSDIAEMKHRQWLLGDIATWPKPPKA
jgi:uncharacterized protein